MMKTIVELIAEINNNLKELEKRSKEVVDYDDVRKVIKKITIIGGKIYVLSEEVERNKKNRGQ